MAGGGANVAWCGKREKVVIVERESEGDFVGARKGKK